LWEIIHSDLPRLITRLEEILDPEQET
jgi:hypothetical protein